LKSSKLIVALGVVGALAGFGASQVIKPRWTAKMTVQIGQIASAGPGGMTLRLVENQLTSVERYNLPASRQGVVQALGLPDPDSSRDAMIIFDTLRANASKSPDVLSLQVSGYSRASAMAAMAASFKILSAEHVKLFEPTLERMKAELEDTTARLDVARRAYDRSITSLKSRATKGDVGQDSSRDVLLTNMTTAINTQILELKAQSERQQDELEPSRTYPTRVLGEPFAPEAPSTPGAMLLVMAGTALGLVIGTLIAFLRRP